MQKNTIQHYSLQVFSAPIESWLFNRVGNLKGFTIELSTNWMDISHLSNAEKWPLLYSCSIERIEKERVNIPVTAF